MKLNFIGTLNLSSKENVSPAGNGTFLIDQGDIATGHKFDVHRIFDAVEFDWGTFNTQKGNFPTFGINSMWLPSEPFYLGAGNVGPAFYGVDQQTFAWFDVQNNVNGLTVMGAQANPFGFAGGNTVLRNDYRFAGNWGPVGAPLENHILNGLIHSTANGGISIQAPENLLGEIGDWNTIQSIVTFLGFQNEKRCYVGLDWLVTTIPRPLSVDPIFGEGTWAVGAESSQQQFGAFALLNFETGVYDLLTEIVGFDRAVQNSHDNGNGTASQGAMTGGNGYMEGLAPVIDGKTCNIFNVIDVDGNFSACDDRGLFNHVAAQNTANINWLLGHYIGLTDFKNEYDTQWWHIPFPTGLFPTTDNPFGSQYNWEPTTPLKYTEYGLVIPGGGAPGQAVPYCVIGGVPEPLIMERYTHPGFPLTYPLPANSCVGMIYYRGLPMYIFADTLGAGGDVTYDLYLPLALRYSVALSGMRNFTRPISPSTGDAL